MASALGLPTKPKQVPLTFTQWLACFLRWTFAAVAAVQISYPSALAHQDNVSCVAELCKRKTNNPQAVAIAYDGACRRKWAEYSALMIPGFDVDFAARKLDKDVYHGTLW